jgi:multicomponent Na+:H+ antiporter subunit F
MKNLRNISFEPEERMSNMFFEITMMLLLVAMFFSMVRMILGPTVWDRLLSLNLISAKVILFLAVYAVYMEKPMLLDVALSAGIIGFLTITLFAKFILAGGRQK